MNGLHRDPPITTSQAAGSPPTDDERGQVTSKTSCGVTHSYGYAAAENRLRAESGTVRRGILPSHRQDVALLFCVNLEELSCCQVRHTGFEVEWHAHWVHGTQVFTLVELQVQMKLSVLKPNDG